ncbi:YdcF family protein [Nodosilinea nodulosa]|uniref:YdcF family protein n=1 Tax=Nodosilinea nodulosa TaxID=416001 RepID=UPI0002E0ABE7|nr:YdcF family protein [Nodosilinea nodulosa]
MVELVRSIFGRYWPKFTWKLFYWLSDPHVVTLTLLVFTAVMLLASGRRYKQQMVILGLGLLIAYWLMISPLFSAAATRLLVSFVPPDRGEPADAVVVLARDGQIEGDRHSTAVSMVAAGRAPNLLVMGRAQGMKVLRELERRQLSPARFLSSTCVRTTNHEAESAVAALGSKGLSRIILITDPPHMLRAWLIFKSFGFSVIPHIEPMPPEVAANQRSLLAIREYLGLVSYAALGRFHNRPSSALPQEAQAFANTFPADRCFMTAEQIRQSLSSS